MSAILASEYVADTMALVLYLEKRKLSQFVKSVFTEMESGNVVIHVPMMVCAEILYLSEGGKIDTALAEVADALKKFPCLREFPMSFAAHETASQISDIPELHDRLIAGVARLLGLELMTNDPMIRASQFVKTVW